MARDDIDRLAEDIRRRAGLNGARPDGRHGAAAGGAQAAPPKAPEVEPRPPDPEPWPGPPSDLAFHGLAGEVVRLIEPQTEADPVAVLVQLLVMFGSAAGRHAFWKVENDRHYANLFCCLVGETGTGRKGTSQGRARQAFSELGDDWARKRVTSGLSSGEGLLYAVRDEVVQRQPVRERGRVVEYQEVVTDHGVEDKRLMVVEPEFGRVLRVMEREGNTLSARLREAWETGNMANLTKQGLTATGAHVSVVAHVTQAELLKLLGETEAVNGLANRFLWVCVRRSKLLPLGGEPVDLGTRAHKIALAVEEAQSAGEVALDREAQSLWCDELYARLTAPRPGILGAVTNRAAAQVRRLALAYSLLDFSRVTTPRHLLAALAVWDYCERSARWTFGDSTGDSAADAVLDLLRGAGADGLTQTELNRRFKHRYDARQLQQAQVTLARLSLAHASEEGTGVKKTVRWRIGAAQEPPNTGH